MTRAQQTALLGTALAVLGIVVSVIAAVADLAAATRIGLVVVAGLLIAGAAAAVGVAVRSLRPDAD